MDCFDLQALPFDVVVLVFQLLDPRSLLAACLTSKSLHEIATPLLYEEVRLGPSHRCTQDHILGDIASNPSLVDLPQERLRIIRHLDIWLCCPDFHEDQREKIGELLNLSSLRYLEHKRRCTSEESAFVNFVINRLPPLRELVLRVVPSSEIQDGQLRRLERLSVCTAEDWDWLIEETIASLKCLYILRSYDRDIWIHIAKLTNLVSLCIQGVEMRVKNMSVLEMLSNLALLETLHLSNISLVMYYNVLRSPTGLMKLHDVTLKFDWTTRWRSLEVVTCILDSITGSSRLRRLKIRIPGWDKYRGEKLTTGILAKHSDTLNVLHLPEFHPPGRIYTQIFSCPKLKRLSIGVTPLLMGHLPVLLNRTMTLERLSLMPAHARARLRSTQLRQLLCQGTSLHSVKLWIPEAHLGIWRAGRWKAEWKAVWEYSEEFQCPLRVIIGPTNYRDPVYKVDVKAAAVQPAAQVLRTRSYTPEVSSEMSEGSYMQEVHL